jgi:hypothetical protein
MRYGLFLIVLFSLLVPGTAVRSAGLTLWDVAGSTEIRLEAVTARLPAAGQAAGFFEIAAVKIFT